MVKTTKAAARSFQLDVHVPLCVKELTMTDKPEGRVEQWINSARDSLPGRRNGLPEGALGGPSDRHTAMRTAILRPTHRPFRSDTSFR